MPCRRQRKCRRRGLIELQLFSTCAFLLSPSRTQIEAGAAWLTVSGNTIIFATILTCEYRWLMLFFFPLLFFSFKFFLFLLLLTWHVVFYPFAAAIFVCSFTPPLPKRKIFFTLRATMIILRFTSLNCISLKILLRFFSPYKRLCRVAVNYLENVTHGVL